MATILLVDDNADGRFAVTQVLRRMTSHEVVEAADGATALETLAARDLDLVLLDVQMPGMDGFEVCRRLRADEKNRHLPVLFLTATHNHVASRVKGLELGADDFIVQPINNLELCARIKSVLRVKALSDEIRRHNADLETKVRERTQDVQRLADDLRAERDALRETFDAIEHGLMLMDATGAVALENATGRRTREGAGPELPSLARKAIDAGVKQETTLTASGRTVVLVAYPVAGRRSLIYARDVTEERDREVSMLQGEKLAAIGMLAAGVAHEINNPIAFVMANIEVLSRHSRQMAEQLASLPAGPADALRANVDEAIGILDECHEGVTRISGIVRDLRSFARVEEDHDEPVDVNAALESALTMLRKELTYRARLERDLAAGQPVRGSAARLGQVFLNLLMNSVQALDETSRERNRLVVRTFDDGGDVVIEVADNGSGIAPDVLPRIFDSFFTTKPAGVGTGLGLPISRKIVRSLGGDITVTSDSAEGTVFRVRLPAAPEHRAERKEAALVPSARRRLRLLVIDDEELLIKAYTRMLSDDHEVVAAAGASQALAVLEKDERFDVILCDLQMPQMSGMTLHARIAARWEGLGDRFVFVTGGAFSVEARQFLEQTSYPCITKPFPVQELLDVIEGKVAAPSS